ncbi:MAG: hypothetical protein M3P82_03375 [Bacteroidota bacterium]|nr:hypothetical protein [Bacteroidota bacterium]
MLATLVRKPFDDPKWLFEIKWDGYRMIAKKNKSQIDITSRNLNSYTRKFPSLIKPLSKLSTTSSWMVRLLI